MDLFDLAQEIVDNAFFDFKNDRVDTMHDLSQLLMEYTEDVAYENANTPDQEDALFEELMTIVLEIVKEHPYLSKLPEYVEDVVTYDDLDD